MKTTEERVQSILAKAAQVQKAESHTNDLVSPTHPEFVKMAEVHTPATPSQNTRTKKIVLVLSSLAAVAAVVVLVLNLPLFLFSGAKSESMEKQNHAEQALQDTLLNENDNMKFFPEKTLDGNDATYPLTVLDFELKSATVLENQANVRKLTYVNQNAQEATLFMPITPLTKTDKSCQSCILTPGGETLEFASGKILITVNKDSGKISFHYSKDEYDLFGETQTLAKEDLLAFVEKFLAQTR